jgi:hypothetical protein
MNFHSQVQLISLLMNNPKNYCRDKKEAAFQFGAIGNRPLGNFIRKTTGGALSVDPQCGRAILKSVIWDTSFASDNPATAIKKEKKMNECKSSPTSARPRVCAVYAVVDDEHLGAYTLFNIRDPKLPLSALQYV